ncbi:conserved hypothetical protein [Neospora caninum Liverpool]|uniref:Transmembrane protein n=1 Tax=Neospora caninum (strain Liverpool) TaxID=572307 RepID=F0VR70_NEOCL|nr:conserved hypothetical protein [Neospora caninum Liverpool]CBZ56218.1 conserved hypothetical protein [Neospora caninum Liverpool]CEL70980.1 TPA: hypothetical protein BN1204_066430 [Neospora caninum Liverpool]|eukprot:XP_003886243.1 conserved hypothetical protein [Neospora caninum Liverpool]
MFRFTGVSRQRAGAVSHPPSLASLSAACSPPRLVKAQTPRICRASSSDNSSPSQSSLLCSPAAVSPGLLSSLAPPVLPLPRGSASPLVPVSSLNTVPSPSPASSLSPVAALSPVSSVAFASSAFSSLAAKPTKDGDQPGAPASAGSPSAEVSTKADPVPAEPRVEETLEETGDPTQQLEFWVTRLRADKDSGALYMLRDILKKPEKVGRPATSASASPSLGERSDKAPSQDASHASCLPLETEDILDQLQDLLRAHGEMTAEVGELLSYRHQTRREGRQELLALGFTGFSTAFAAAIHPFFFLGTLIGMRSLLKARAPELDREAGARRLQEIRDSLQTQEKQIFKLSEMLLELEGVKRPTHGAHTGERNGNRV